MAKETMVKSVAVIGAGCTGLGAVKSCLEEGLEPICFEQSTDIGGLWRYTEEVEEGRASIYRSVVTNASKEMSCYSDFLVPAHFPNYLHNSKVLEYYKLYAEHFDLMKHIKLKTKVCSIKKGPDFSTTGQWEVITESDGKHELAIFDAVMVCAGRYVDPCFQVDSFCGLERFKGRYLHSREYKRPNEFEGKRVLVVGLGNSGVDIATEVGRVAAQVFLSTRRGAWVMSRLSDQGYPWDTRFTNRFYNWIRMSLPIPVVNWLFERYLDKRFNLSNYGLARDGSRWKEPLVSDDLPVCIMNGLVMVRPATVEFSETSVTFEDGTQEDIDVIIFATGFHFTYPFLEDSVIKASDNHLYLYKNIFPPELEKPTLAIIGLVQPIASILVAAELQARWATRVLKGVNKLPSLEDQMRDIHKKNEVITLRYGTTQRSLFQIEFIEYIDELASEIGVKPSFFSLLLRDPRLALEVFFSSCTSPQFRLTGPGKWDGARDAILTKWDRILKPMKTRVVKRNLSFSSFPIVIQLICVLALIASLFMLI